MAKFTLKSWTRLDKRCEESCCNLTVYMGRDAPAKRGSGANERREGRLFFGLIFAFAHGQQRLVRVLGLDAPILRCCAGSKEKDISRGLQDFPLHLCWAGAKDLPAVRGCKDRSTRDALDRSLELFCSLGRFEVDEAIS